MRYISIIFLSLLLGGVLTVQGQTALEKAMDKMNVSMKIPSYFSVSSNEDLIYVTEVTDENPYPTIAQNYGFEPSYGSTAFKVMFAKTHSIMRHKNEDCLIFIYVLGAATIEYGKMIKENAHLFKNMENPAFNRIKRDFRYGKPMSGATDWEAAELDMMLTRYPKRKARKMFNANRMVMYPFNLRGNVYEDKYTRCRAVVIAKNGLDIYFYFMLTDESAKNFDTYLKELNKVFWFND